MNKRKINITVSEEIIQFYQSLADDMGIPRSAAMVVAMKTYMDQQKSLRMGDMFGDVQNLLAKFEGQ